MHLGIYIVNCDYQILISISDMPHESKRGDLCGFKRGGRKQLHNTYMSLFENLTKELQ